MHSNAHPDPVNDVVEALNCQLHAPPPQKKKKCYHREVLTLGIITAEGQKTIVASRMSASSSELRGLCPGLQNRTLNHRGIKSL